MMTFQLNDDYVLRVRQRELWGPVTVEVLGPPRDVYCTRPLVRKLKLPADRFVKLFDDFTADLAVQEEIA